MKDKKSVLKALNEKAKAIEALAEGEEATARALQEGPPGMPAGCTTVFDTGWETNPRPTYPVGNCQASARDFPGCAGDCWWPAQVPDGLTNHPDFDKQCPSVARDWRKLQYD
ncbi:MAG: quinohemoprotein amine dehydrogenase [Candidatus Dadabacteria bacterium]|nr:MAG: quinohemoprotein amine dehydrogenase [Candidatus Dadabacteria bacterium]